MRHLFSAVIICLGMCSFHFGGLEESLGRSGHGSGDFTWLLFTACVSSVHDKLETKSKLWWNLGVRFHVSVSISGGLYTRTLPNAHYFVVKCIFIIELRRSIWHICCSVIIYHFVQVGILTAYLFLNCLRKSISKIVFKVSLKEVLANYIVNGSIFKFVFGTAGYIGGLVFERDSRIRTVVRYVRPGRYSHRGACDAIRPPFASSNLLRDLQSAKSGRKHDGRWHFLDITFLRPQRHRRTPERDQQPLLFYSASEKHLQLQARSKFLISEFSRMYMNDFGISLSSSM